MGVAVSVIMPCYRSRETLAVAVSSVLAQTMSDFELIVVDDGSPDDSAAIALQAADSRVRVIRQDNAGPAAARNNGILQARGNLVAFLDSDDRWTADLLAEHCRAFEADAGLGVSFARVRIFDPDMTIAGRCSRFTGRLGAADILGENPICTTSNIVVRRDVLRIVGGFDETLTHAEDQEWVARILLTTPWHVVGLDRELVHYRTSADGLSSDLGKMLDGWQRMIESLRQRAPGLVGEAERSASAIFYRYLARRALRAGQTAEALAFMRKAWRAAPATLIRTGLARTLLTTAAVCLVHSFPYAIIQRQVSR